MIVIISSYRSKSRLWSWFLVLEDGIYTDYYQLHSVCVSYAISQRGIALVTSNKLLDAEYKPYQVRNSYRSST